MKRGSAMGKMNNFVGLLSRRSHVRVVLGADTPNAVALLLAPVLMGIAYICTRLSTGLTCNFEIISRPYLVFIFLPYILFLGGPLGEEIGRRGTT